MLGVFQEFFKLSMVKPLHQKSDRMDMNNYRPVTLTSCFSKIIEKALYNRTSTFLSECNIFGGFQFGFRKGFSAIVAVSEFFRMVLGSYDKNIACGVLFLDLLTALDDVDRDILCDTFGNCGIRAIPVMLIRSYLLLFIEKFMFKSQYWLNEEQCSQMLNTTKHAFPNCNKE